MIKKYLAKLQDIKDRHDERHASLKLRYALADSIDFLNAEHWGAVAATQSMDAPSRTFS